MTVTATEIKSRFGEYMDKAQREPVTVEKTGRNYAVLVGYEEYQKLLQRLQDLEDAEWGRRATEAEKSGFIGSEASMELLEKLLK